MAKINRRRLSKVISAITALVIISYGAWLLTLNYKPFSTKYFHQRNVEHIEAKYGKPYAIYRQEEKDACISEAQQLPITGKRGSSWLGALSSDKDIINQRISQCDYGTTDIMVSKNETMFAYFKSTALFIIAFFVLTILVSWLTGVLLTKWLPSLFSSTKRWLTTDDESGS